MRRTAPDKELIPAPPDENCACNTCPHMKRNTLEKLHSCLSNLAPRLEVEEGVRLRAKRSIERMLEMTAGLSLVPAGNRG
jgi:quinolinate synthase